MQDRGCEMSLKHSAKSIYDHSFNVEFKGYSLVEVDGFLDQIIEDYQAFDAESTRTALTIQDLQKANANLQAKIIELQARLEVNNGADVNAQQRDLLKRLAKLESEIYNK